MNKFQLLNDGLIINKISKTYGNKKVVRDISLSIKRGNEIITGDYGILDTNKNSYKVSSKNSKKVKAIISNTK